MSEEYKPKKEKDSFLLYHNDYGLIKRLSNEEKGILLDSIFKYSMDREIPNFYDSNKAEDRILGIAFESLKTTLDINYKKWLETCEKNQKNRNVSNNKKQNEQYKIFLDNQELDMNTYISSYESTEEEFYRILEDERELISNLEYQQLKETYNCKAVSDRTLKTII